MCSIRQVVLRLCAFDKWFCGFAASRAESLWLSVKPTTRLAAVPPEAKPLLILANGKPKAFREGGKAAPFEQIDTHNLPQYPDLDFSPRVQSSTPSSTLLRITFEILPTVH